MRQSILLAVGIPPNSKWREGVGEKGMPSPSSLGRGREKRKKVALLPSCELMQLEQEVQALSDTWLSGRVGVWQDQLLGPAYCGPWTVCCVRSCGMSVVGWHLVPHGG